MGLGVSGSVLLEALIAVGFYALAIPFGFLSRRVKQSGLAFVPKWALFLGVVHTPVLPLIAFVKLAEVTFEFEVLLVAIVLMGHTTGVLVHRRLNPKTTLSAAPAST